MFDQERVKADEPVNSNLLQTDPQQGLTTQEVESRIHQFGENRLPENDAGVWRKLAGFFWGPIPWMIEIAAILSAIVQHWSDFAIILIMLFLNVGVGFWQEYKAGSAIAALRQRLAPQARVCRDGKWCDIQAAGLVPGDIVRLKLGDIIPADVRLLHGDYLRVDQSALTGESLALDKKVGDVAYSGSIARQGQMDAIVTATGMATYIGKTARLVQTAGKASHFQRAVLRIGNFLILMTIGLIALIMTVAVYRGDPITETLLFALILAVAAIPVALPTVLSVTMAVGAEKLAKMKAIVSRLVAIEEMAGMDILCSDKTGTLTQNRLTVGEPVLIGNASRDDILRMAALASEVDSHDPIDGAIYASLGGADLISDYNVVSFRQFDPVRKRAEATIVRDEMTFQVAKGAPQAVLSLLVDGEIGDLSSLIEYAPMMAAIDEMARRGYRSLAVARTDQTGRWQFMGLLPLFDPPREDAAATIAELQAKGVDIRMITGDHEAIGREIARQLGLGQNILPANDVFDQYDRLRDPQAMEKADGFARVFPQHKYAIVHELQGRGHIVGMTGDGVNDAPALKQADIGIAVSNATDAARAAADLVLTAPGISVITSAIEESRRIFGRMNSYATFRISETIRVLLFMTISILVFDFYPVTAIMIVLLALLNDFPIMMIAYDNADVAPQPIRWNMVNTLTMACVLGGIGVVSSFGVLWIADVWLHLPPDEVQVLVFLKLLVAGHLTIYLTRHKGFFWQKPYPSWKLFVATEITQVIGTMAAVYGWLVPPIGWYQALIVWGYALGWFVVAGCIKVWAYRLLTHDHPRQAWHLARVEGWLHRRRID
ncbi:plasma-membrane proton-efflux P-type ATPase [Thalassospira sp. MCCC 1A03138]|uniref:plasma-membrane proton-efflux P-type ATPase n=1 Tax=Thalassospira sp. MCCC 1A03138 TaxID=1470576 RepID=UPI000A1DA173|nr:plasma-membrane proton-efflux P-type ATPase [Thalassospira sp. MCCC 1A03138]OSQ31802.1 metal ABC transporter ATPase [Thalassospira sp. MCCC 1A03138]